MKKFLLASVALVAAVAGRPAGAADLARGPVYKAPPPAPVPYFSWTGFYAGVNAGGGWENTQTQYSYSSIPASAPPGFEDVFGPGGPLNVLGLSAVDSAIAIGFLPTSLGRKDAGFFTAGGQIGFNYQIAPIVLGVEADLNWMNGVRTTTFVAPPNLIVTNTTTQTAGLRWLGTVRARAGFAFDRALIFATGGWAFGRVAATTNGSAVDLSTPANVDLFSGDASGTRSGYAVGGGIEYALTNYLTVKGEYLYYNLGTANYAVAPANSLAAGEGLIINASQKFDGSIVRAGLNYRFGWGKAPVVARY
jgi:outer membrane immunogenic protein